MMCTAADQDVEAVIEALAMACLLPGVDFGNVTVSLPRPPAAPATSSIGVETVSNNGVTLQNGQYKLTGRIGDGHGAVKQGTEASPRAHIHPTVAIYYAGAFGSRVSGRQMNTVFQYAAAAIAPEVGVAELPSRATIGTVEIAVGTIAMAYVGIVLLVRGALEKTFTLILDAGSMRAGKKYQAAVASFLSDENSEMEMFNTFVLGSIPLAEGTDDHRKAKVFEIFEDILIAMKALAPQLLPLLPIMTSRYRPCDVVDADLLEVISDLSMEKLLVGCDSFLGDHGESSLLGAVRDEMVRQGLGDSTLADPRVMSIYFCHFHKLIRIYDSIAMFMVNYEKRLKLEEHSEAAILALDDDFPNVHSVAKRWRRASACLAQSVIHDLERLAGAWYHAHESMYQGHKMLLRALRADAMEELYASWTNPRGARGTGATADNAGSALLLLTTRGPTGIMGLIDALVKLNGNRTNNLYECIREVACDMVVCAQMGVWFVLNAGLMVYYRHAANTMSQSTILPVLTEYVEFLRKTKQSKPSLNQLTFVDAEKTKLCRFCVGVTVSRHHTRLLPFCCHPSTLDAGEQLLYQQHSAELVECAVAGTLKKIEDLCTGMYGDVWNMIHTDPNLCGPHTEPETKSREKGQRVQAASTAVESTFGKQSLVMEMFPNMNDLHIHCYLLILDTDIASKLSTLDLGQQDAIMVAAMQFARKVFKPRMDERSKLIDKTIVGKLKGAQKKINEKRVKDAETLLSQQQLSAEWIPFYTLPGTIECLGRFTSQATAKDWLKERCVQPLLPIRVFAPTFSLPPACRLFMFVAVHSLHLHKSTRQFFIPAGRDSNVVSYLTHSGVELSLRQLAEAVCVCAVVVQLRRESLPPSYIPASPTVQRLLVSSAAANIRSALRSLGPLYNKNEAKITGAVEYVSAVSWDRMVCSDPYPHPGVSWRGV